MSYANKKILILIFALCIILFERYSTTESIPVNTVAAGLYTVEKVIDGDTLVLNINSKKETVRMIGVNTPETVDPRRPVECFGNEASNKAKELLLNKNVRLESDSSQGDVDKYDRQLRYVYLEDGTLVNKLMIEEGYAYEYTYDLPYIYQTDFKNAQMVARDEKRGLWADGVCE